MQRPPEYPEIDEQDERDDDLVDKIYGPSQSDIDRSWDGYKSAGSNRKFGGLVWKLTIVIVSVVILASMSIGVFGPLFNSSGTSSHPAPPQRVTANVLRVIDGRTIVVDYGDGEQTVRLIGVESPAFGDPFRDLAQEVTQSWIGGKEVLLELDQSESDGQGRLMRYVFIDDVMINAAIILNGLGRAATELPNTKYDDYLADMERQARESGVGIWDSSFGGDTATDDSQTLNSGVSTAGADQS